MWGKRNPFLCGWEWKLVQAPRMFLKENLKNNTAIFQYAGSVLPHRYLHLCIYGCALHNNQEMEPAHRPITR